MILHYFGVLCLNSHYFYRNDSYFCTTILLNVHKPSQLKVGRVRNSGTHVLKTILKQYLSLLVAYFHRVRVNFKLSFETAKT